MVDIDDMEPLDVIGIGKRAGISDDKILLFMAEKLPKGDIALYLNDLEQRDDLTEKEKQFRAFAHGYGLGEINTITNVLAGLIKPDKSKGFPR